eukprot:921848-Prorocentrum_lima.AAC.1
MTQQASLLSDQADPDRRLTSPSTILEHPTKRDISAYTTEPCWIPEDALQAAFPTEQRMRQKAKEEVVKLEIGE